MSLPSNTLEVPFDDGDYRYSVDDCPFCGSGEHLDWDDSDYYGSGVYCLLVVCNNCLAHGPRAIGRLDDATYQSAVDMWNTRKG